MTVRMTDGQQVNYTHMPDRFLLGMTNYQEAVFGEAIADESLSYGTAVFIKAAGEPPRVGLPTVIGDLPQFWGVVALGKVQANDAGLSFYTANMGMAIVKEGNVVVAIDGTAGTNLKGEKVYVHVTLGTFTKTSTGNIDIGAYLMSNDDDGKALVHIPSRNTKVLA